MARRFHKLVIIRNKVFMKYHREIQIMLVVFDHYELRIWLEVYILKPEIYLSMFNVPGK